MKKTVMFLTLPVIFNCMILSCTGQGMENRHYEPSWNSLGKHTIPEWFKDAKFGIYTHWGVYSVPAKGPNGSWYPHNMYKKGTRQYAYHVKHYGDPAEFGYKDFIPMFKAEKFDAEEWAELFYQSGARFAGPVAEHHDGFSMWDTKWTEYNAKNMGPKRDILGELTAAIRRRGMKTIATFHHATHWAYYPHWVKEFDCSDPQYTGLYGPLHDQDRNWPDWHEISPDDIAFMSEPPSEEFLAMWTGKLKEVIDKYQPDLLWFDGSFDRMGEGRVLDFFAYYFNQAEKWGREVEVLFKGWDVPPLVAVNDLELGREQSITRHLWITDTSVDDMGAWSYAREAGYKSVNLLVDNLVDRISKNGLLLLNIGPKADGSFPEEAKEKLLGIGEWLRVNGEAIYGTRAWVIYGEGPTEGGGGYYSEMRRGGDNFTYTGRDIRFTVRDNMLYAIFLEWPGKEAVIRSLKRLEEELSIYWEDKDIRQITMLGDDQPLKWHFTTEGLHIQTPAAKPCDHAYVLKIERNLNK